MSLRILDNKFLVLSKLGADLLIVKGRKSERDLLRKGERRVYEVASP